MMVAASVQLRAEGMSERRRSRPSRGFEKLLMLEAVRCPRQGVQPFRFNGRTVHDTSAEGPVLDPPQRLPDLLQHGVVEFSFREGDALVLVYEARIARVTGRVRHPRTRCVPCACAACHKVLFEFEQAAFVLLCVHGSDLRSSRYRKQPRTWSLTMPTACMCA